jgi:hypothetical protein
MHKIAESAAKREITESIGDRELKKLWRKCHDLIMRRISKDGRVFTYRSLNATDSKLARVYCEEVIELFEFEDIADALQRKIKASSGTGLD